MPFWRSSALASRPTISATSTQPLRPRTSSEVMPPVCTPSPAACQHRVAGDHRPAQFLARALQRAAVLTVSPIGVVSFTCVLPRRQIVTSPQCRPTPMAKGGNPRSAKRCCSQPRNWWVASATASAADTARRAAGSGEPLPWSANNAISPSPMNFR